MNLEFDPPEGALIHELIESGQLKAIPFHPRELGVKPVVEYVVRRMPEVRSPEAEPPHLYWLADWGLGLLALIVYVGFFLVAWFGLVLLAGLIGGA